MGEDTSNGVNGVNGTHPIAVNGHQADKNDVFSIDPKMEKEAELAKIKEAQSAKNKDKNKKKKKGEEGDNDDDGEDKGPPPVPPVGLFQLFRFSSGLDKFLIIFGLLLAFCTGSALPVMSIVFGDALQAFVEFEVYGNCSDPASVDEWSPLYKLERFAWIMCSLGGLIWVCAAIFFTCLNTAAARQVFKIRGEFLKAVLRQDISWYDTNTSTDFASRMTEDLNKLQEGIGEKIAMLMFFSGTFFISMGVAFYYGWELTLVLLTMVPIMTIANGSLAVIQSRLAEREMSAYATAGAIAEEVLSGVRTVVAFGGQDKEINRYTSNLVGAKKSGILRGMLTGVSGGLVFGIMFAVYGLGFWFGVKLIMDDRESDECTACFFDCTKNNTVLPSPDCIRDCIGDCVRYNAKSLITVFFSVLFGGFQLGQAAPYVEALSTARSAAGAIYRIIDRKPPIDSSDNDKGIKPKECHGQIKFRNVKFSYPSRPDVPILNGINFDVATGKTVALVGSSGCGKSTCIQLVQRFYDPNNSPNDEKAEKDSDVGQVFLDDVPLTDLNVVWLRNQIGVVSQEPVLFDASIKDNILTGRQDATDNDILEACKKANALTFIEKLPDGLNTMVGERGTQLSGGQKQRIAIARALVRNPRILLLDEATSALDTESESVVQAALDTAREGRTTIVVAHRLTTVRNADMILALDKGEVQEQGTHNELMDMKGLYYNLVMRQVTSSEAAPSDHGVGSDEGDDISAVNLDSIPEVIVKRQDSRPQLTRQRTISHMSNGKEDKNEAIEDPYDEEAVPKISYLRLFKTNMPEIFYILIGVLSSTAMGGSMPVFSILFSDVTEVLSYEDTQKARDDSVFYAGLFVVLGAACAIAMFLQGFMFAISGENLTMRLRGQSFAAMLRQEIGWFDDKANSTGALCARLSGDAAKVQGATGARVGSIVQGVSGMLIAIILGIVYDYRLGLVCTVFFPLLLFAVFMELRITMSADTIEKKAFESSSKLAVEGISNIRTVAGLGCEPNIFEQYMLLLRNPHKTVVRKAGLRGLLFGFSQAAQFFGWGLTTYYGGVLVSECKISYSTVLLVTNAIIGGAGMIGYSFAFSADFNKAVIAASRVFTLLDRKPLIEANPTAGLKLNSVDGNIKFDRVEFTYPSRLTVKILKELSLAFEAGQKVALVGESGCGKSTLIQLIQRFYDVDKGSLSFEGHDIQSINVPYLRSNIGIVSQEPTLFDRTIAENIQYGDNSREVEMEAVIDAARRANIHNFITSLPQGYNTRVGSKGTQLSGGQKQRVAIARALVRNPRILLLDEATSALDTESEKIVQEALDAAQVGRTSITIAHRLSTIQDSDVIFVFDNGRVAEKGSHAELLKAGGLYHKLWHTSATNVTN